MLTHLLFLSIFHLYYLPISRDIRNLISTRLPFRIAYAFMSCLRFPYPYVPTSIWLYSTFNNFCWFFDCYILLCGILHKFHNAIFHLINFVFYTAQFLSHLWKFEFFILRIVFFISLISNYFFLLYIHFCLLIVTFYFVNSCLFFL